MPRSFINTALVLAAGTAAVLAVGAVDYVTGNELRLFPLYFLPIAFVSWRLASRPYALALSFLSAVTWLLANAFVGRAHTSSLVWPINFTSQLIAFSTVGVLLAELQRRLAIERGLSRIDPLTSLPNRRAFTEGAELLLALARRSGSPLAIAFLDLDNFKTLNDEHGHAKGIDSAEAAR